MIYPNINLTISGYPKTIDSPGRYVIHHHYKEVISTDSCFALHLGLLLEDKTYELADEIRLLKKTRLVKAYQDLYQKE